MKSLQDLVDSKPDLVDYLYNDTISQFHRSRTDLFSSKNLIAKEYTSWRDEHDAFHETCVLTNQSHHMPVLYVKGPDAYKMLQHLTPLSFANLSTSGAKQYFAVAPKTGKHIGDCVMYYYGEEGGFELISGMPLLNWVRFHGESGEWDVEMTFDPTTPFNPTGGRTKCRFQLEGPATDAVMKDVTNGEWQGLKFFRTTMVTIGGRPVQVLGHGMGATGGVELSGAYEDLDVIRDALMKAGEKYGIRLGGTATYFSAGAIGGWVPYPLPAIYTGEELRAYREWLPHDGWEGNMQLAGSFYSNSIEDYYWTASALGYDRFVKFDHDFIGRDALEAAQSGPRRVRRVLRWNRDDIVKIFASQFDDGPLYKAIEMPSPLYGWPQADEVRSGGGQLIGMSQFCAYNRGQRDLISVCGIDEEQAEIGNEVVITWGEKDGGSRKPHVERHEQTTIRATVHAAPYRRVQPNPRAAA